MRFKAYLLLLSAWILAGCSTAPDEGESSEASPMVFEGTVVALGDSLTSGYGVTESEAYPARLEELLRQAGLNYRVVNAGVAGETSSGLLSRVDWVLASFDPEAVIVITGGNDGLRGSSLDLLERNLDAILSRLTAEGVPVVFGGMRMLPNLGPYYAPNFEAVYPRVAERHEVIYVPFALEGVAGQRELFQRDGIHPTAEGNELLAEHLLPAVLRALRPE